MQEYLKQGQRPRCKDNFSKIGVRIGRFFEVEEPEAMTKGMPKADAYRLIAARVEHEVKALRDGAKTLFDADALKKQFRQERRNAKETTLTAAID